ncbi:hypothetical protein HMPREF0083_06023 [Aneurinibacillus aneurinilyticus ATCC 12856]|uniref:Uncharacterized protein n=1 Tax=Aneurinibacillus aneurinilyticus ATCC 12856 TaxID=649747 RepID=U1Y0J6_ANEAE|nr:hypothetical protein HMPREF0083_06023 [Aneurinibacillus aneurinilyticus ATCC 12856]
MQLCYRHFSLFKFFVWNWFPHGCSSLSSTLLQHGQSMSYDNPTFISSYPKKCKTSITYVNLMGGHMLEI